MKGKTDLLEQIRQQSIMARAQAMIKEQRERYMNVKLAPGAAAGSGGGAGSLYVVNGYIDAGYFANQ